MADLSTIQTRIETIDGILAGPKTVTRDGITVVYDFAELRVERARLMRIVANQSTSAFRRVVFKNA